MKVLHLYKKHFKSGDGITTVVNNISYYQNKLIDVDSYELPFSSDDKSDLFSTYRIRNFYGLIRRILKINPDVIFIHGVFIIKIIPLIFILKTILRKKLILVPHCSLLYNSLEHKKIKKIIYLKLFNLISLSKVDAIQFLNEYEEKNSISLRKKMKTYILPNGISKAIDKSKDFSHIKPFYLGRCDINHKGIDILIKGLSNYIHINSDKGNNFVFNLYGALPEEVKKINPIIEDYNILKNIIIHPPVFSEKKEKSFIENNIYIMMSRYEGMPMSVLEALSFGCICILSEGTNMANIIEKHECGFKASNDLELSLILSKLESLTTSELEKMSINAKELIKNNFLWENIAIQSISEIKNII
ncbi:glycosyltransferase [Xenorhabdus hominickii]|nr:glycosyltransferase [Xenorhabdus hominickii]AOM41731.1 hypothetical protein A9255_14890 [Xenorhabdus hominickii]